MQRFLVLFCIYFVSASFLGDPTQDGPDRLKRAAGNQACEPISETFTSPKTGQKAWDKCVEYQEQLIFPCEDGPKRANKCGHNVDDLIIRDEAYPNEFPHMALVGSGELPKLTWYCNGALISDRFILVAGHCKPREPESLNIAALGVHKTEEINESNLYKLVQLIQHPSYKPPVKYNDIALYKTEKPVQLSQSVVPACLHVGDQVDDHIGVFTGWNLRSLIEKPGGVIQMTNFQRYSDEECTTAYSNPRRHLKQGINTTTQVCFGDKSSSIGKTCQANGGGPIQVRSKKMYCMYTILGVASFGKNCGDAETPEVYTRVAPYVSWIESVVWP